VDNNNFSMSINGQARTIQSMDKISMLHQGIAPNLTTARALEETVRKGLSCASTGELQWKSTRSRWCLSLRLRLRLQVEDPHCVFGYCMGSVRSSNSVTHLMNNAHPWPDRLARSVQCSTVDRQP